MEVIHYKVQNISRKSGGSATAAAAYRSGSAVAAAAYRAGEKLYNDYDGQTHDYAKKRGVVYSRILLPDNAPRSFFNRETLWNEVEKVEKSVAARLARDINFALPCELERAEQIQLVQNYVQVNFIDRGMCADIAIHDTGGGNPHVHVLLTTRSLDENGQWLSKQQKNYILDENGNKIYDPTTKTYKCGKSIKTNDWDDKENIETWRRDLADGFNREFERLGIEKRVTHESYERQGVDREVTEHMGQHLTELERRGIRTARGERNREKLARNRAKDEFEREVRNRIKQVTYTQDQGQEQGGIEPMAEEKSDSTVQNETDQEKIAKGLGTLRTSSRIISQTVNRLAKILELPEDNIFNTKNSMQADQDRKIAEFEERMRIGRERRDAQIAGRQAEERQRFLHGDGKNPEPAVVKIEIPEPEPTDNKELSPEEIKAKEREDRAKWREEERKQNRDRTRQRDRSRSMDMDL